MDLNQSVHHYRCSSPAPIAQVHNFMHVSSPMISLNNIQQQYSPNNEMGEESLQSRVLQLQRQNLQLFWHQQILEIDQLSELTLRSWLNTEESRRRTLQRIDIANAVNRGEVLDFLVDVVPANDSQDEECEKNCGGAELSPSSNGLMNFAVFDHQF
ncbi:hypothetical protein C5167_023126 [Papaver somniferum]|uniref:Uncharacterized protein n=1 Tax=Papaver somniferum TaxID=3469 RepID=A0A4Y7JMZ0_PAPSO|nr:hypothetical protein C5167_023126 [Papaver somniferum]